MAAKKSAKYPYKWSDGTWHSIPDAQHKANVAAQKAKPAAPGKPIVPTGTYDPNLDAQLYASRRGLQDLVGLSYDQASNTYGGDIGKALERGSSDFIRQTGQLKEDYDTGVGRTEQGYQRSLSDLLTSRARGGEDYRTTLANLQRNYDILGTNQSAAARKAGVASGGAFAQSAQKRAANQALEKAPIDTAYQRALTDSQTAQTRLGEDRQNTLADLMRQWSRGTGELGINYQRSTEDLNTQAERGIREGGSFEQDIQAAKVGQFQQMYPGAKLPTVTATGVKTTTAPRAPLSTGQQQQKSAFEQAQARARAAQQAALARARKRRVA
jgi:hypothetical protein